MKDLIVSIITWSLLLPSCGRIELGDMDEEKGDKFSVGHADYRLQEDVAAFFSILREEGINPQVRVKSVTFDSLPTGRLGMCNIKAVGIGTPKNNIAVNRTREVQINQNMMHREDFLKRIVVFHELIHCSLHVVDGGVRGHNEEGHTTDDENCLMAAELNMDEYYWNEDTQAWTVVEKTYTEEEANEMLRTYIRKYRVD